MSRSLDSVFEHDPFFEGYQKRKKEMDKFFHNSLAFQDHLGFKDSFDRGRRRRGEGQHGYNERRGDEVATRNLFDFGSMFSRTQQLMENMFKNFDKEASDPNSHMLSHTSFSSYSNMGGGSKPKIFQAATTTRQAPGGLRETRKMLQDSESGQEKMAIGRYIGDKGHMIQRERNHCSNREDENREYINMLEDEYGEFDREWKDRTRKYREGRGSRGRQASDRTRALKY